MGDSIPITLQVARESSTARKDRLTLRSCSFHARSALTVQIRLDSGRINSNSFFSTLKLMTTLNSAQIANSTTTPRADHLDQLKELNSLMPLPPCVGLVDRCCRGRTYRSGHLTKLVLVPVVDWLRPPVHHQNSAFSFLGFGASASGGRRSALKVSVSVTIPKCPRSIEAAMNRVPMRPAHEECAPCPVHQALLALPDLPCRGNGEPFMTSRAIFRIQPRRNGGIGRLTSRLQEGLMRSLRRTSSLSRCSGAHGDTAFVEWTMGLKNQGLEFVIPAPPAFASVANGKNR